MGLFNLFQSSKTVVVVDGVSLNEALGQKGKIPPRTQLQLLRRLARFAQREKLELVVVLSGNPLHKAPAGKKFEEITVKYSKSAEAHAKYLLKTAKSKGNGAILISGNTSVEKAALSSAVKIMRVSTFRKAFDVGGNEGEGGGKNRDENDRKSRGGNERGNRNRSSRRRQSKSPDEKKQDRPPKEKSEVDAINELIDLVD